MCFSRFLPWLYTRPFIFLPSTSIALPLHLINVMFSLHHAHDPTLYACSHLLTSAITDFTSCSKHSENDSPFLDLHMYSKQKINESGHHSQDATISVWLGKRPIIILKCSYNTLIAALSHQFTPLNSMPPVGQSIKCKEFSHCSVMKHFKWMVKHVQDYTNPVMLTYPND